MTEQYVGMRPGSDLVALGTVHYDFDNGITHDQVRLGVYNGASEDDTYIYLEASEARAVAKQLKKAAKRIGANR